MGATRLFVGAAAGVEFGREGAALAVDQDVPVVAGQHAVARRERGLKAADAARFEIRRQDWNDSGSIRLFH